MRISLNELKQTEDFLSGDMPPEDAVVFRAKLLIDPSLRKSVGLQQKLYALVRGYGRKKLRQEIEAVHNKLFHDPAHRSFRLKIESLFTKP